MLLFSTAKLQKLYNQGEEHVSHDRHFLVDRISLSLVQGQAKYTLPDYVESIKRITYRGMKLDPLSNRNLRDSFQGATQQGEPFWYVYNNIGLNQIQLFPVPSQSLAAAVSGLWDTAIPTSFVIEFYRITDNATFVIPPYLKPQLLKSYVAMKCSSIDGAGLTLKMRQYYEQRWDAKEKDFEGWIDELMNKPRKLVISEIFSSNYFPGHPILPIDKFGIAVDEGY
jgi:hypothetical protein